MSHTAPDSPGDKTKPGTPAANSIPAEPRDFNAALKMYTDLLKPPPKLGSILSSIAQSGDSLRINIPSLLAPRDPEVQKLKQQILDLESTLGEKAVQLTQVKADKAEKEAQLQSLKQISAELRKKQELDFLLSRVTTAAEKAILATDALRQKFFAETEQPSFVLAIDIRRSTDLMLKARSPALFAAFMTELCGALEVAIKEEYGVFDKFTGDGVLAFFPEFFSGTDAGYHAIAVAQKALSIFEECYRRNRSSFTTILRDVNLTVGIDFGSVHLVQVAGGLTVVGVPVVYACRLSGGPPGTILLNQPAYEKISETYGNLCLISETDIEIKNEGGIVCYTLKPSNKTFEPAVPSWTEPGAQGPPKGQLAS